MFGKSKNRQAANRSGFESGMAVFANVAAMGAAFFGTGPAYSYTLPFVLEFAARHYGHEVLGLVEVAWFILVALGIYGLSRATIYTSIMSLVLIFAARIF